MKKPIIPDYYREIYRHYPNSFISKRVELTLALERLKREIITESLKILPIKYLASWISEFLS